MEKQELYKEGLEEYSLCCVIGQNVFLLIYFAIGFIGMWSLQIYNFPAVSILYGLFLIVMLLFLLRKHLCTHCYYYGKFCNVGWGKLSAFMFKKNSGNYGLGVKLASITWTVATSVPIIGIVVSLVLSFSIFGLILLILFISLSLINIIIHKKVCEKCKMKFICPASMAK